ncbi:MAG: OsmC family protein [Vicinamibacterales bacterium]
MRIAATVKHAALSQAVSVMTDGAPKSIGVPAREDGRGSAINGGELLMLALATCYCNDLYREASRRELVLDAVEVEATADFDGVGAAATNVRYRARVASAAPASRIEALLRETDAVAEVHKTVRVGTPVELVPWDEV